jgi:hypothetical protein
MSILINTFPRRNGNYLKFLFELTATEDKFENPLLIHNQKEEILSSIYKIRVALELMVQTDDFESELGDWANELHKLNSSIFINKLNNKSIQNISKFLRKVLIHFPKVW